MHQQIPRSFWIASSVAALVVIAADQITKALIEQYPNALRTGGIVELYRTANEGIAFSIPVKGTVLYALIGILIIAGFVYGRKHFNLTQRFSGIVGGLIIGGGIGNLIDRIRFGYVVDFIKIGSWPLFNIADASITVAILCLIIFKNRLLKSERDISPH